MTEEIPDAVERALDAHEAFEACAEGYELATTVLDATVTADEAEGEREGRFRVVVTFPTLDAVVVGESVAPVVEDGWFETLERRLADVFDVAHTSTHEGPALEREGGTVRVRLEYTASASEGVDDAKALVEFVEGTYVQGIVPGYEYRGPAAELLESAQRRGQRAADGNGPPS